VITPTLETLRAGPPTVDVRVAAAVLGISKSALYEALRCADELPVKALHVRGRWKITTASLVRALEDNGTAGR